MRAATPDADTEKTPLEIEIDRQKAEWREKNKDRLQKEKEEESNQTIGQAIDLISDWPDDKKNDGKLAKSLRKLNADGAILFGDTIKHYGAAATWDGKVIEVSDGYIGFKYHTALEFVHEHAHAEWGKSHPKFEPDAQKRSQLHITDEYRARVIQIRFYKYLRKSKGCGTIEQMEIYLRLFNSNRLLKSVEEEFHKSPGTNAPHPPPTLRVEPLR